MTQIIMTSLHFHTLTLCNILQRVDEKSCLYKDVIYYRLFRIAILFRFNSKKRRANKLLTSNFGGFFLDDLGIKV